MQEIVTLACEKWAAGDKVTSWQIMQTVIPVTVFLLIYLAPKCEEQREVCKPDCNKFSEKIWARLERDSGRGFQF